MNAWNLEWSAGEVTYFPLSSEDLFRNVMIKFFRENLTPKRVLERLLENHEKIEQIEKNNADDASINFAYAIFDKKTNEEKFYKRMDAFLMTKDFASKPLERASVTFDECRPDDLEMMWEKANIAVGEWVKDNPNYTADDFVKFINGFHL